MENCLYIVEGECEKQFLRSLQVSSIIKPGRIVIFNLMQEDIRPSNSILSKRYNSIICIIDTDVVDDKPLHRFLKNMKALKSIGKTNAIIQNKNFEDELAKLLNTNTNNLYSFFKIGIGRKNELKHKFTSTDFAKIITADSFRKYGDKNEEFSNLLMQRNLKKSFTIKTGANILCR